MGLTELPPDKMVSLAGPVAAAKPGATARMPVK